MRRTLYVTADGLLQPLGYSQVFRLVEGLGRRGVPYAVVSMERAEDLANLSRVREVDERLAALSIDWTRVPYVQGDARAAAGNLGRLTAAAIRRARRDVGLVHARSYHGASVALVVERLLGIPYLFDTRSYWIDERLESGRWFRRRPVLAAARVFEGSLYRRAAGVVTLTRLQADDVANGRFGPLGDRPLEVIPTCADFEDFRVRPRDQAAPELRAFAGDGLTLGFVGSVNASYRLDRAAALARAVLDARPDAKIVALGSDPGAYRRLFDQAGIDPGRVLARRVEHEEVSSWLSGIDWGVLLLASSPSKRASMPTKLGEFFAAGVRPIHHGCNSEVADWVTRTGSGLSLPDLGDEQMARATQTIATSARNAEVLERARVTAEAHFSLQRAFSRYEALLRGLVRSR